MRSTLGIDLGNWSCHVAYSDDIWMPKFVTEVKTQISQIKCLLGRKFSDPELQLELDYVPFRVIEGPHGYPLVHGRCKGEDRAFTPVEILAMLISSLKFSTKKKINRFTFTCTGIPMYFTDQQKKDVLQAAKIAGFPASFCLLDETTATLVALERNISLGAKYIVAFVDIGHASMQVCFAEFEQDCSTGISFGEKWSVNILYKGYARSLGGREFDKVLFNHFACRIRKEYNIDVSKNSSASVRLSEACGMLKYNLSRNNEACFSIENFSGSVDVKGLITRKEFESLSISILKKIEVALKMALNESGLNVEKIDLIHAVGKGCSIPAIIDILTKFFGKKLEPIRHEDVAEGCASQAIRLHEITGTDKMINDLNTTGLETSELGSRKLNSEEEKVEDSENLLWRRAMHEKGHLLTFLNDFLEKNMDCIGRSEKTETESYWLSKANYNFDVRERPALQRELSEAQKLIEQLMSERDDAIKLSEAAQKLTEQLMSERDDARKLSEAAQKLIEQLTYERDDARKEVEELRRSTEQQALGSQYVGCFAEYSYSELQHMTNNFHESFKLGEGGFGVVYKGILHNTTIAIKMLKEGSRQGAKEFNQEIEILSKVRHPNLVTLLGACSETHAVIYEYLPNGSLEDRLRCKNNTSPLSWQARTRIAFEICSALSFLHCSKPHGIVHGDLKPDNILLDLNNVSKISDFGLCRELKYTASASVPCHWTECPKGTFAYMDPEYLSTGKMTPQYDVYSFGIMLLLLVTCKDPRGIRNLVEEAQKKGTTLKVLIDTSAGPWPVKEAKKMISLGLRCSDPIRKNRPDLSAEVWKEMKSIAEVASASLLSRPASLFRR